MKVTIYDTTLRDGSQMEGVSFSVEDKLRIARRLDAFGIDYIEGGWPGAVPKDTDLFARLKAEPLQNAKLVAFGMTRRAGERPEESVLLRNLLEAGTPVVTIVGKTHSRHVTETLRVPLDENLAMIQDSVAYLKAQGEPNYIDGVLEGGTIDGEGGDLAGDLSASGGKGDEKDPMYDQAVEIVLKNRKASISLVQRHLKIGYNRSARMLEDMEKAGLISAMSGSGQRDILVPARAE